ncbi:d84d7466-d60d-42c8-9759-3672b5f3e3fc [Thermothielavioides terrestris]|uniref:D84d7466-d60d-42c8-9759-3672b5f3e3fc n=1 Tax=Thermothielavioides terrestris TaxID=2587410 RepID=A0A446BXM4_9PEZI|nr:d84d7466-d60d-42c8-9759-3672b5f3e3fc [Thermothielavioides terrestris]
MLLAFYKWYSL